MDVKLDYNFRDILSVPAHALKTKKIFICAFFLLLAVLIYSIFAYSALLSDGRNFSEIFAEYGLIPCTCVSFEGTVASVIFYLGVIIALMLGACCLMGTAIMDFESFRGNRFFSSRKAIVFCFKSIRRLFMSWFAIVLFIGFIILLGIVVGLIARIPYIGDLIYSVFFFFPNFIVTIFLVLIIYVLALSYLVMPAAVAFDKSRETFNSILETFSTLVRQPIRWLGYTAYTVVSAKIAGFVFAYFAFRAVQLLKLITEIGGGARINDLLTAGLAHLPVDSKIVTFVTNIFPGVDFGFNLNEIALGGEYGSPASLLMAISLFLVFLTIWGYIFSVIATGQAYAFAVIKYIRDGYAITEEKNSKEKTLT